jgi:hypothetical protein
VIEMVRRTAMSKLKLQWMAVASLALLVATCASVPMTAPAGTLMFLQANPSFVVANGGTSVVTALLTEPAGTLVPDGTVVLFFTTLGRIDEQGQTRDGVARVNFVADSRSGTAIVTAFSGGPAPAPAPSGSPTPTPAPAFGAAAPGSVSASAGVSARAGTRVVAAVPIGNGTGSATITIDVGSALPAKMVVTANPPYLAGARDSTITANVFDANGNPVQNVPVIFSIDPPTDTPLQEVLASGGAPQYTDSNGQAFDRLTTKTNNGALSKIVTVRATTATATALTVTVDVIVNYAPTR